MLSLIVTALWDPGLQALLATRAGQSRGIFWVVVTLDLKWWHQTHGKALLWEISVLWSMAQEQYYLPWGKLTMV